MQMHSLVRYGDTAAVQRRLNAKPLDNDQQEGTALLNIAAASRHATVDMLQLLIEHGVNPNTVARAYRELELAGVVVKRRTTGTYVSNAGSRRGRRDRLKIVTQRIDALLVEARQINISLDEVLELMHERDQAMQSQPMEK